MNEIKIIDLDPVDLQLLTLLQTDASRSNQDVAAALGISAPTCLRRTRRLVQLGVIEKQVAIVQPQTLPGYGPGLQVLVEVTLERQYTEALDAFEALACAHPAVQQCWRVSPGPDFMLVLACRDMPDYLRVSQELFTQPANVRNAKAFFATKRAKFGTQWPLHPAG
ncbi:Lrp/AsnC family transcriptional regulator [Comamonas nitrativorans]|uniref:Lrp/AsnC family transcriptional regulator n=1 Tax=Comamonas nitrativorans TaxID=108437 RepID=A0ABV9GV11_9BURK